MEGWIKLHRKIRDNPIFNDLELYRLATICLTEAYHKEVDQPIGNQVVNIKPGQFPTGRFDLHDMYNKGLNRKNMVSEKTVWRWLKKLEKLDFLTIKSTNKYSVISINNWSTYQQSDQQMTNRWPTDDQQMTTNKNVKNDKNEKNKERRRKQVYDTNGEPFQLAKRLFDRIRENDPEHREPNLHTWADDMRKLIDIDKKDPRKIANLIDWVQQDDFEQTNVLSASKLRKRYDQLTMKARREYKQTQQPEQGRGLEKLDPNNLYGEG